MGPTFKFEDRRSARNQNHESILTILKTNKHYIGTGGDLWSAREDAVKQYNEDKKLATAAKPKSLEPQANGTLQEDIAYAETIMAGLTEKAKRLGYDGRLLAMANTDFERGFMALDKAVNKIKKDD